MKQGVQALYSIESMDDRRNRAGVSYTVAKRDDGTYHCSCPAFQYGQGEPCKHIEHVINTQPQPDVERLTSDEFLKALVGALGTGRRVVVEIKGNSLIVSDDR